MAAPDAATPYATSPYSATPYSATRRRTILVVEDDRATSDLLRDVVEEEGFRFVPAVEGHLALQLARDERPSAITLDLDLPDTDGHAVLHRLLAAEATRDIPILVITGHARFLPDGDCHRVAGVLEKPLDVADLAARLHALLDHDGLDHDGLDDDRAAQDALR